MSFQHGLITALVLTGCTLAQGSESQNAGKGGDGKNDSVLGGKFDMFLQVNMTSFQDTEVPFKIFSDTGRVIGVAVRIPAEDTDPTVVSIDQGGLDCRLLATSRGDEDVRGGEMLLWMLTHTGSEDGRNVCKFSITQPSGKQAILEVVVDNPT